jgi:hypothetical protein
MPKRRLGHPGFAFAYLAQEYFTSGQNSFHSERGASCANNRVDYSACIAEKPPFCKAAPGFCSYRRCSATGCRAARQGAGNAQIQRRVRRK